jgi:hypothetical protein
LEATLGANDVLKMSDLLEELGIEGKKLVWSLHCWSSFSVGLQIWVSSSDKNCTSNAVGNHCLIHQQVLAARTLPSDVK